MMLSEVKSITLTILFSLMVFCGVAEGEIRIPEKINSHKIKGIDYFYSYKEITFDEIKKLSFTTSKSMYIVVPRDTYQHYCWFKLPFRNTSTEPVEFILKYHTAMIDELYLYNDRGVLLEISGDSLPFNKRSVYSRNPAFNISVEPGATQTYFIYAKSHIPFRSSFELLDRFSFYEKEDHETIFFYLFALVMCLGAIYFFYLFVQTKSDISLIQKDTRNMSRVAFFLGVMLLLYIVHASIFSSFFFPYLWPNHPIVNNKLQIICILSELASVAMIALSLTSKYQQKLLYNFLYFIVISTMILILILMCFNSDNFYFMLFVGAWCIFGLFFITPNILGAFKKMKGKSRFGIENGVVFLVAGLLFFFQSTMLILSLTINYYVKYDYYIFITALLFFSGLLAAGGVYLSRPDYAVKKFENDYIETLTKSKQMYFDFTKWLIHQLSSPVEILHWNIYCIGNTLNKLDIPHDNKIYGFTEKSLLCIQDVYRLIANFKVFSTGRTEITMKKEDLREIIRSVLEKIIRVNEQPKYRHKIVFRETEKFLPIKCNRVQIEHALYEIIYNSVLYTPAEGTIEIIPVLNNKTIKIDIVDNGEGIDAAIGNNLFELYFIDDFAERLKCRKTCGLGLPTSNKFVNAHKGKLSFVSPLNPREYPDLQLDENVRKGTLFTISLGLS